MQMIKSNRTQLTSLSLPPSALVIDTRGPTRDDVMKRLEIEIADLASEMKTQDIHHWRYLTEFLSFLPLDPMPSEEVDVLRQQKQGNAQSGSSSGGSTAINNTIQKGLTGDIESSALREYASPFFFMDNVAPLAENRSAEILKQNVSYLMAEINRIRNNRHVAVADIEKTMSGRSIKEAIVRVIFLADAERPESLATTAVYAAHLKKLYARTTPQGQQSLVNIVALCLNNSSSSTPSADLKELLWDDTWEHLDSLILTEDYREDAAWIAGAMQPYLAELLLYVLLIIPSLRLEAAPASSNTASGNFAQIPSSGIDTNAQGTADTPAGQSIPLPPYTFLIGMAAMEHSARWGRRLLNYKMVEQAIQVMQNTNESEKPRIKQSVNSWLRTLRAQVKNAIPDKVPGNITALQGIARAGNAIKPVERIFTLQNMSLHVGKETIKDLESYRDSLASTYATAPGSTSTGNTLQDAIDSIPHIQHRMYEWESKDPALRRGMPLVNAQLEAQRVLSNPDFFIGANGAVVRARMQLEELGAATSNFRNAHEQNPIDIARRQDQLVEDGNKRIGALQEHVSALPILAMKSQRLVSQATFILVLVISAICTFLGVAWLRHAIVTSSAEPTPALAPLVNGILFSNSLFAFVFWLPALCIVLAITFYVARGLLSSKRTAWSVEIVFFITLFVFAFVGSPLTGFSLSSLSGDQGSLSIIGWLSFLPIFGIIAFILLVIGVVMEIWYYAWWYGHLLTERAEIVHFLDKEHRKNINDVSGFIADTITLHLLARAKLVSEKGGAGEYFQRVNALNQRLRDILEDAQEQQRMARQRLAMSTSDTQLGVNTSSIGRQLNMRIRDELLDIDTLAKGHNRLVESLDQEKIELKMLAEIMLRVMGEEAASQIEMTFRENLTAQGTLEQQTIQILMTTLVAMTLRLSFNVTSLQSLSSLLQQYDSMVDNLTYQPTAMQSLVDNMHKKMRQDLLQPIMGKNTKASEVEARGLATTALAAWGQMLWEGRDQEISHALSNEGVLPRLLAEDNNIHMIKRLLGLRTSLFGRNFQAGQIAALYLLIPYSSLAHQFSQDLNVQKRHIIHFPDVERLVLLYAQPYAGEVLFIPDPPSLSAPAASPTGVASPLSTQSKPSAAPLAAASIPSTPIPATPGSHNPLPGQANLSGTGQVQPSTQSVSAQDASNVTNAQANTGASTSTQGTASTQTATNNTPTPVQGVTQSTLVEDQQTTVLAPDAQGSTPQAAGPDQGA